ncbi:MAG: phosphoribosylglycinamide formyltransferase [Clostridiales bacterium]|jgi:phosphoribosylglycinamide formyltransferase-1|nr:phosphoribosylglycinamide formyltransferase [Clostridiales bacterium]
MNNTENNKRIAVLVSGGGTNLQALIDNDLAKYITIVISNKAGAYALQRAGIAGIDTALIDDDTQLLKTLTDLQIDLIVLAGYTKILKGDILTTFDKKIINVHPSLIPSFCGDGFYGLKVHEAALNRGVKVTGATVHYVNDIVDGGEIIAQKCVQILPNDTPETLQKRVMQQAEHMILPQVVKQILNI